MGVAVVVVLAIYNTTTQSRLAHKEYNKTNHKRRNIPTVGGANRLYLLTSSLGIHSDSGCQVYVSGQQRYDGVYWPWQAQ